MTIVKKKKMHIEILNMEILWLFGDYGTHCGGGMFLIWQKQYNL